MHYDIYFNTFEYFTLCLDTCFFYNVFFRLVSILHRQRRFSIPTQTKLYFYFSADNCCFLLFPRQWLSFTYFLTTAILIFSPRQTSFCFSFRQRQFLNLSSENGYFLFHTIQRLLIFKWENCYLLISSQTIDVFISSNTAVDFISS